MRETRLPVILWILSSVITASAVGFTCVGTGFGIEYSLISGVALTAWSLKATKPTLNNSSFTGQYLLSIVCLLVLNTCRYRSYFGAFVFAHYPTLFRGRFVSEQPYWFLIQVCLPISFLLLGGYLLTRRAEVGRFFAWWGLLYCVAEALIQFVVELTNASQYTHTFYVGTLTAMVQFAIGISGLYRLNGETTDKQHTRAGESITVRRINLWSALFISAGVVYAVTLYNQAGPLPVGVIIGSMMGGLVGWRRTTARSSADPNKVLPLYLLLLALFYVHVGEEVLTHFNRSIALLSGHAWSDTKFDYTITLLGPSVWVYAAYSLGKRQAFGNFILWFMIVGMILGEPTHLLVFPVIRMVKEGINYEYFPGMYSALFPMIPALLALLIILNEHTKRTQPSRP